MVLLIKYRILFFNLILKLLVEYIGTVGIGVPVLFQGNKKESRAWLSSF